MVTHASFKPQQWRGHFLHVRKVFLSSRFLMIACHTSRGQCLCTHHCFDACASNPSSCITLTAVGSLWLHKKVKSQSTNPDTHTRTSKTLRLTPWASGKYQSHTNPNQENSSFLLYRATAVTSMPKYVNHHSFFFFCKARPLLSLLAAPGGWECHY